MPTFPLIIETERLLIRPFEEKDIQPSYQMNLDPEMTRYTGDGGIVDLPEMERRIREDVFGDYQKHGYGRLAVEWKANGQFIGFSGLKYLEDLQEVDLGYRFLPSFWGKGIATESGRAVLEWGFKHLNVPQIIAWVIPENTASVRVLEKLGFQYQNEVEEDGLRAKQYGLKRLV